MVISASCAAFVSSAVALTGFGSAALAQTTYYVAPPASGGADANSGTLGAPWATLQRAANGRVPGDTVIVLPGTYAGFNVGGGVSGTAAAPITFRGTRGGGQARSG